MIRHYLLVALLPALAMAAVSFTACPNGAPTPATLTVNDCSGDVCNLYAGQHISAVASGIVSPADSASVAAHISAFLGGLDLGFEIPPHLADACAVGIEGGCPLSAGMTFSYSLNADSLEAPARGVPVEIEVGLIGDGGVALACLRFNAVVN
ncbi:uncharacterized protein LOC131677255 [Topomyia yanbarensis]|uniref:uncharacterized protein LOC131677255 n=1 Tax=Topomyia yanbarensis TaxID=2498891 RepID=UPI00273CEC7B|nr:uncharacterized protein LOC131677255 [Topomyia yanbarensis]